MKQIYKNELCWKKDNKEKQKNYLNKRFELIKEISNEKMNNECFDCRKNEPKYISINNAIFLCEDCSQIHKAFPDNISFIIDNNLNLLSNNYLNYLYYGGNFSLDHFINYVYPGLQNYSPEILYKTQAMIYYREKLKCKIESKPEPPSPNDIMAYKLVSEKGLINIREENIFNNKNTNQNKLLSKDIINNYYNNYNNTYNTFNNYTYSNDSKVKKSFKQNIKMNENNNINYCSLVNKAFFNEMKDLFGELASKKLDNDNNNKINVIKSYKNIAKTKTKFQNLNSTNRIDQILNQSSTYRLNDSINYSLTNRTNTNEPLTTNRKLNKSAFYEDIYKSPNKNDYSPRYIKPIIRIPEKKKNTLNNFYIEKGKLKKKKLIIDLPQKTNYNETINNIQNKGKIYKQKKKLFNCFQISKKGKDLNNSKDNLSFEFEENIINKNELTGKINKNLISYLYNKSINNIYNESISTKNNKKCENINKPNKIYLNSINLIYNSKMKNNNKIEIYNKNPKINKNMNISYDITDKRRPIKVNLTLNNAKKNIKKEVKNNIKEMNKKALEDKKEQEKLEQEASHNLLFEQKNNDLFNNIIYLKKKKY